MNDEVKSVIIGELCERVEANQIGLLSLFKEVGIPVIGPVKIHDIQTMFRTNPGAFERAIELLYPEGDFVNADGSYSEVAIYKGVLSGEKDTSQRLNDLGLGNEDGSNKYDPSNTPTTLSKETLTVSYKTILKYIVIVAVAVGLFLLLRHYYRKIK